MRFPKLIMIVTVSFFMLTLLVGLSATTAQAQIIGPYTRVPPPKLENQIRVHFLPVGAGRCSIVECPGTDTSPIIYDCGSLADVSNTQILNKDQVADYVNTILDRYDSDPIVVIGHPDADHSNLLPTVFSDRRTKSVWLGGQRSSLADDTKAWFDDQIDKHRGFEPGFHNDGNPEPGLQCGDADSHILTVNVPTDSGTMDNSNSLVLAITLGKFRIIFSGDAEGTTQQSVLGNLQNFPPSSFPNVDATVLQVPHHGSRTNGSSSTDWVNQIGANVIVFSAGVLYGHPTCKVRYRYLLRGTLAPAGTHRIRCGKWGGYVSIETTRAEYLTHTNGLIVITGNSQGLESVECGKSPHCSTINAGLQ